MYDRLKYVVKAYSLATTYLETMDWNAGIFPHRSHARSCPSKLLFFLFFFFSFSLASQITWNTLLGVRDGREQCKFSLFFSCVALQECEMREQCKFHRFSFTYLVFFHSYVLHASSFCCPGFFFFCPSTSQPNLSLLIERKLLPVRHQPIDRPTHKRQLSVSQPK